MIAKLKIKSQIANRPPSRAVSLWRFGEASKSQIALAVYLAFLLFLVARSPARRVGDGGEYVAMAMNLAAFRPPSLSQSDLHRIERRFQTIAAGYETVPLEMPALRAGDGRQDLPHFWLYPLLAVPALWATDALGAHPNYAFTFLNVVIACSAFVVLALRTSIFIAVLMLAGPLIWWIDKAHGDVFTVSLLAIGFALLQRAPGWALIALGAAAAQNPPLAPVFALAAAAAIVRGGRSGLGIWDWGLGVPSEGRSLSTPKPQSPTPNPHLAARTLAAAATGAALTALPFIYYEHRLGVPTPLAGWTKFHVPHIREIGAFVWDPNIGLIVNHPVFVMTAATALVVAARRRRITTFTVWLPLLSTLVLLVGFAQSVNINHGATPGMNRWILWLTTLAVPVLIEIESARLSTCALAVAAAASTMWSVVWFSPERPENYKSPTATARWIWTRFPSFDNPPIEIFAERISGSEPPLIPTATSDCRKVLAMDGVWPVPCLPPLDAAQACTISGSACYANIVQSATDSGYRFAQVRYPVGLDFARARAWPIDPRFATHLRRALDELGVQGLAPAAASESGAMLRAAHGVAWTYVLQAPDRLFVYLPDAGDNARLTLRLPGPMAGGFVDLSSGERLISVVRGGARWTIWDVNVPPGRRHLALVMKMTR